MKRDNPCSTLSKDNPQRPVISLCTFKRVSRLFQIVLILLTTNTVSNAQISSILDVGGYFKELGQLSFDDRFSTFRYDNSLQNRLETDWSFSNSFEFKADMRTRLISGYSIKNTPFISEFYEMDSGFVDATWIWFDTEESVMQSQVDRFYASYYSGDFELHAGRQRINWARTFVWSPNDLFNNYAFLDFDYEERPGVDALLAQYNWSFGSSVQIGFRMADEFDEMVLAGMLRTNWGNYDMQFLGGHYLGQFVIGAGWAGYIQNAGFKGEMSFFLPEEDLLDNPWTLTATVGFDYMMPSSLYLRGEMLYNGGFDKVNAPLANLIQPPSADNLFIAKTGLFMSGNYPVTPLLSTSFSTMASFDRSLFIFIPQMSYSLSQDIDLTILMQALKGHVFDNVLDTSNLLFFQLKWSY